jgi:hypothetical protein
MIKRLAIAVVGLAIASCGRVADLEPQAGKSLPQKPALAAAPLSAEQLLALPTHAQPVRVDELTKRGEIREADRFDLPPPDGVAVPQAGSAPAPSTTGPDNQGDPE